MKITTACLSVALFAGFAHAEDIENPSYKLWSQYNPGTAVTINGTTDAMGNTSKMTITTTLKDKADDKLTLSMQTSISVMGKDMQGPAQTQEVPKMIDKAKLSPNMPSDADIAKAPEESVTVPAGTFKCKKLEVHKTQGQMKIDGTSYYSEDVPGGMVKVEMTGTGQMQSSTTMQLQSIDKK